MYVSLYLVYFVYYDSLLFYKYRSPFYTFQSLIFALNFQTEIEKTSEREPSPQKKIVTEEIREKSVERVLKENVPPLAPEFTVPLHDATVQEGEKFTFQCNLVGQPAPEVVWYKDGISILNNPDYLTTYIHGVCTLTIEETFAEDSAKYTCRAFNIAGSAETSATLTVKGNF